MRKINRYSYNLSVLDNNKVCDHDIWYVLQRYENDGIEKYSYICICLYCGKTIYETDFEKPLPANSILSEITLKNGQEIFIPYNQVKSYADRIRDKYKSLYNKEVSPDILFKLLQKYYNQEN